MSEDFILKAMNVMPGYGSAKGDLFSLGLSPRTINVEVFFC